MDRANGTEIRDPYRTEVVGSALVCTQHDVDDAGAAIAARDTAAAMPGYERAALLRRRRSTTSLRSPS